MRKVFDFLFSEDALWIWIIAIGILISFSSCGKEDYPDTDKIYDAVEDCGYDSMREFIREYYDVDDIFEREEIMDEAIGNGWVYDHVAENPDDYADIFE